MKAQKSTISDAEFNKAAGVGAFVLFGIALIVFALLTHFSPLLLIQDIFAVYQGSFAVKILALGSAVITSLHLTLFTLAVAMFCLIFMPKGKSTGHFSLFQNGPSGVYLTIFLEELFARYLVLGVIAKYVFQYSYWPTMVVMLLGNTAWAALHLLNYKDPSDRKPLAVLSQFVTGLILFYVFMRYGFWLTLLVHLTFDFVLFSMDKVQTTIGENIINLIYWVIAGAVTLAISWYYQLAIPSIAPWLINILIVPAGMWEMVIFMVLVVVVFGIVENLFGFDHYAIDKSITTKSLADIVLSRFLAYILYILVIMGFSWLLSLWITTAITKAIIISLILVYLRQPKSGSAMANLWFTDMPIIFLQVFVALTFPFWPAVLILTIPSLVSSFPAFINAH